MNMEFVEAVRSNKDIVEQHFKDHHPCNYKEMVKLVVKLVHSRTEYGGPNPEKIHEIDDGGYHGTLLYVIPEDCYQPDNYWFVKVGYGSCSGCDALESVREYGDDPPTEEQIKAYYMMCMHIAEGLKEMK